MSASDAERAQAIALFLALKSASRTKSMSPVASDAERARRTAPSDASKKQKNNRAFLKTSESDFACAFQP